MRKHHTGININSNQLVRQPGIGMGHQPTPVLPYSVNHNNHGYSQPSTSFRGRITANSNRGQAITNSINSSYGICDRSVLWKIWGSEIWSLLSNRDTQYPHVNIFRKKYTRYLQICCGWSKIEITEINQNSYNRWVNIKVYWVICNCDILPYWWKLGNSKSCVANTTFRGKSHRCKYCFFSEWLDWGMGDCEILACVR